jgi:23S rRNA (guanine745-N1)-methyltransferase
LVPIICPICSETLVPAGRSWACVNRHSFDLSKEGYLSLLHGRGNYKGIGDDKEMVRARIRVHELSAFLELAKAIAGYGPQNVASHGILDIGCGDGFFLNHVTRHAATPGHGVGVDISKEALAKAAKTYPSLFFVRAEASHNRLPFEDSSFGLVLSIFAPRPVDEIRRVLRPDGSWLVVTATQDHLREIREFLPLAAIGAGKLDAPTSRSFVVVRSGMFNRELRLSRHEMVSIVEMSPSIHRLRRDFGDIWGERLPQELRVTLSLSITLLGTS